MRNKYFKFIITFAIILCTFCTSVTVLATVDETTPVAPAETENVVAPTEPPVVDLPTENNNPGGLIDETEENERPVVTTQKPIVIVTEDEDDNTTTTKKKPSSTTTTRRNNNNSSSNNTTTTRRDNSTTSESSTDTTLPDGQFYVHLVLGNGEKNKKTIMKEPGLVTAPPDPVWEGYIFEGWYSDAEFTKPWDFAKDKATKEMTIYARWSVDTASIFYTITVSPVKGGKITVSPVTAVEGTPVVITIKPDSGKRLVDGSLTVNGKKTDVLSFNMPAGDVLINASFEDVPAVVEDVEEKDNSIIIVLAIAGVLIVGLVVVGIVMLRRRNEIVVPEFDENGAVIIEDDDEIWVDESLVIEDAFPDAKPVTADSEYAGDTIEVSEPEAEENDIPVEKTKGLRDIVNTNTEAEVDNDAKLNEAVEEINDDTEIADIDFSLFE